jgi:hypothetical protein
MKKKYFIAVLLVFSLLSISIVSSSWPFTGKVSDGTSRDDSNLCEDSDGGIYSERPGIVTYRRATGPDKESKDKCLSDNKLREYFCKKSNGKKSRKTITCEFGCEGNENGVGSCITPLPSCEETEDGAINEKEIKFMNRCSENSYLSYSCDGAEIIESETECPNRCSNSERGCIGTCSAEIDPENDPDTPGSVTVDGKLILDKCNNRGRVKQYTCENSKLKEVGSIDCGANRECVSGESGAYCRDIIEGTKTITELSAQITSLQELLEMLTSRIATLEANA